MSRSDTPKQTHLITPRIPRCVDPVTHASELIETARSTNQRRLIVIAGEDSAVQETAEAIVTHIDIPISETVAITTRDVFVCERLDHSASREVMGTTRTAVILDLRDSTSPNVMGRAIGAIDGGGIGLILTPSLSDWPQHSDAFQDGLVVEPFTPEDVGNRFVARLIATLQSHDGIAIIDADNNKVQQMGTTDRVASRATEQSISQPTGAEFPAIYYHHCRSNDQRTVLSKFEQLAETPVAIVVSAERGRGKSSVAGIGAAALAEAGWSVGITAPERSNVRALFNRVADIHGHDQFDDNDRLSLPTGGSIAYFEPAEAVTAARRHDIEILFVDEAAGLAVNTLEELLICPRIAFTTTRHGYEGAGHGFAVKFRESLAELDRPVIDVQMHRPIRYAENDPIERWLTHVLLLDATPAVDATVNDARPETVSYCPIEPDSLATNETLFREVMGLLATAHYRTDPDDIARILDAPNLRVVSLKYDNRVVAVALIAQEGNLSADRVESAYCGERLRGNLLPDIFCTVWRDDTLARQPGIRILRIATHVAVRRRGLGTQLLEAIRNEYSETVEWLGTGFGATPALLEFWIANDFVPISLAARRNRASGAYSAILLDRHFTRDSQQSALIDGFSRRLRDTLTDVHRAVEPAVVMRLLQGTTNPPTLSLTDTEWRHLTAAAGGPGRYELDPGPARALVFFALLEDEVPVSQRTKELLVAKVLQGHTWPHVTELGGYQSITQSRQTVGGALDTLLDYYGPPVVEAERKRLRGEK